MKGKRKNRKLRNVVVGLTAFAIFLGLAILDAAAQSKGAPTPPKGAAGASGQSAMGEIGQKPANPLADLCLGLFP